MASTKRPTKRQRRQVAREVENIYDKKFSMKQIAPLTETQVEMFNHYERGQNLVAIGSAGTGKTYVATYLALRDVLEEEYDKVLFIRSAVQSRDQGFMPGSLKEKEAYYELPFIDIVNDLFQRNDAYGILKQKGMIDFKSTSFIRGLTFDNCIILVDESQNLTYGELSTILTRCGNNSKIVICGDTKQDDLVYNKNKADISGLRKFLKIVERIPEFSEIKFNRDDIVRSGIVKAFLIAEEELEDA